MPTSGSLYIFLHGLSVVADTANQLEVVLPLVQGHVHRAGNWFAETTIAPRSVLRLRGVNSGTMSFSQTQCSVHLPGISLTSRKRAATILLPRPKEILELLLAEDPDYVAQTKRGSTLKFKRLATVQVLVYGYSDENEVQLDGHYWESCPVGGSTSLHIISTSEEPEGKEHEESTEDVLSQVIRDYPGLEYKFPRPLSAPFIDPEGSSLQPVGAPGPLVGSFGTLKTSNISLVAKGDHVEEEVTGKFAFAQAELEHPTSRLARLARLGRMKRAGRPIEALWRDPDVLTERITNCVSIGG